MRKLTPILAVLMLLTVWPNKLAAQPRDTTKVIQAFSMCQDNFQLSEVDIDTSLNGFHRYNPIYQNLTTNNFLGNIGLASSTHYFAQREHQDFIFANPFVPYMHLNQNTLYYTTRKPYTDLQYTSGTSLTNNPEQTVEVLHTQNFTKDWNFGLRYNLYSSEGQYAFQKSKNNALSLFSSYRYRRYFLYTNGAINKMNSYENGGIVSDTLVIDKTTDNKTGEIVLSPSEPKSVQVRFDNTGQEDPLAQSVIRNKNFFLRHGIYFGERQYVNDSSIVDSLHKFNPAYYALENTIQFNSFKREYLDDKPAGGFYPYYYDNSSTTDSVSNRNISTSVRFIAHEKKNSIIPGVLLAGSIDFVEYTYRGYDLHFKDDSTLAKEPFSDYTPIISLPNLSSDSLYYYTAEQSLKKYTTANTSFKALLFKNKTQGVKYNVGLQYFFTGYRKNDLLVKTNIIKNLPKHRIKLNANISSQEPSYFYKQYGSNNYTWVNSFVKEKATNITADYLYKRYKLNIIFNMAMLNNYVYLNSDALPQQHKPALVYLSGSLQKTFSYGILKSQTRLIYQSVNNKKIIPLPDITVYNSTYLDFDINFGWTNGLLKLQAGADIYYWTKYNAPAYMPALGMFHNQGDSPVQVGSYPVVDAFFSFNVKSFRFFFKSSHVTSGLLGYNYFSSVHYPLGLRFNSFGASWRFYN